MRELGHGSTGRVMLAVDEVTRTEVAIRYLDPRLTADDAFMAAYRPLARRLTQLEDPGIADLYELVDGPDGAAAVVMQRVDGVPLRRILDTQGPTGPLAALTVFGGALAALAVAHRAEAVHRDVRPENMLVDRAGQVVVTDFGLVPPRRSRSGDEPPGTPAYLAPELWNGAPASPASDLYAATVVFFECLTGRRPYESGGSGGRAIAALGRAHREAPVPADAVPGPLRGLIASGLAKDPADRPASAEDFLAALEEAAVAAYGPAWEAQGRGRLTEMAAAAENAPAPAPAPAKAAGGPPDRARPAGRGRLVGSIAAIVVVTAVAGASVVYGMDRGGPSPAQTVSPTVAAPPASTPAASPAQSPADALAARITTAAAQRPSASFSYQGKGCCGANATAKGTFAVRPGQVPAYTMTASSPARQTRKAARVILIGETAHVRQGDRWRQVPASPGQAQGYAPLAARVRECTSVDHVVALAGESTDLRRSGRTYRGTVAVARLGDAHPYAAIARAARTDRLTYTLVLDAAGLPSRLTVTIGTGRTRAVLTTAYGDWGRRVAIDAPR
ncbi:serine/threonine-protein kinase [Thermomonospora cellulosilytica]|uniref:non-specific serine/threonine protein kinase n=1 Tax=Thermomonospora cellulosilytica TaxID=1411118 RepID=A0A7W3MT71_9ACTN|nr:serine/threonine-protein kinase [Thermomonospora cellulosilytica]MBA9001433.1 serine/threonine-protein kinase [Thermomonospora cellulosilytica]